MKIFFFASISTYGACGFVKVMLFFPGRSHNSRLIPIACKSLRDSGVSFSPNRNFITNSAMFFSTCITLSTCLVGKPCTQHFMEDIIFCFIATTMHVFHINMDKIWLLRASRYVRGSCAVQTVASTLHALRTTMPSPFCCSSSRLLPVSLLADLCFSCSLHATSPSSTHYTYEAQCSCISLSLPSSMAE